MSNNQKKIKSVEKAFQILEIIGVEKRSLVEVSRELGMPKSTAFFLIDTMENLGYLRQNPETKEYSLGIRAFQIGESFLRQVDLRSTFKPYIKSIGEKTGETVHVVIWSNNEAIYLDKYDGNVNNIYSQIGSRAELHASSVGKVILAFQSHEIINMKLSGELKKFTKYTITDIDVLLKQFIKIKQQGFAIDNQEIALGFSCVAVPVFDAYGKASAAISVSGNTISLTKEKINEYTPFLIECSKKISNEIGWSIY
ncbi:MAG: hypothetical protein APF76_07085 [Desulfitibacter sp. BRH_c19]|nr:MAG: hypothetical protein APF76_07085 [Desulfitibacter sp. BRH_c19]